MKTRPILRNRGSVAGRALLEARVVQVADVLADPDFTFSEARKLGNYRTVLGVPLLREGVPIGVIVATRAEVRPFTDKQIELLTTFADQAVIAIENVRLFDQVQTRTEELTESLQQQTATADVLKVISSSPGELSPVFNAMLDNAARVCEAKLGILALSEGGGKFRVAAMHGAPPELAEKRTRDPVFTPGPSNNVAIVAKSKKVQHVPDLPGWTRAISSAIPRQ